METNLTILAPFFEEPNREFSIRELSRILKINHTTIRMHLNHLKKEGHLSLRKQGIYTFYRLTENKKTINIKLYYNLEKIRKSGIIEDFEREYALPTIVIFGSYAKARDNQNSDIDICLISNINKEFKAEKYEKELHRKVSIHRFTKQAFEKSGKTNPGLVNSICNGIVLSGELEIF